MSTPETKGPGESPAPPAQVPPQNSQPGLYQQMAQSTTPNSNSSLFMNPHAAAQAATAALAAAAQQVAQAQMQANGNSNSVQGGNSFYGSANVPMQPQTAEGPNSVQTVPSSNISRHNSSGTTGTEAPPSKPATNVPQQQPTVPAPAVPQGIPNPQQIALSAQAQAAAILAAGSLNPALFFNPAPSPQPANAALAAAQVVASLMQQQQQQQQPTLPQTSEQTPQPNVPNPPIHHINHSGQTSGQPNGSFAIPQNHNITAAPAPVAKNETSPVPPPYKPSNHSFVVGNQQANTGTKQQQQQQQQVSSMISHNSNVISKPQNATMSNGLYAAAAAAAAATNPILLAQMQHWKLDQLEAHAQLLRDANQPIPQPVSLLLAEARRREEKRTAKRVANRKSACTSRARKKALVEEMTRTNAKLKRQALILSLLPDLVIAIKVDGTITFCSAQVERVLRHKVDSVVGANISQILVPSCRTPLQKLIDKLLAAEQQALMEENNKQQVDESGVSSNSGGANGSGAAIVSEQSDQGFPLSVVKVKSRNPADNEGKKSIRPISAADSDFSTPSPTPEEVAYSVSVKGAGGSPTAATSKEQPCNGDDSSSSNDAKQLLKANKALSNNVRRYNAELFSKKTNSTVNKDRHKDDVTGASVTPNNAGARLSSLQHTTEENLNDNSSSTSTDSLLAGVEDKRSKSQRATNADVSEDSGYRESGESDPSREDSASSASDTSNARPRPLAPTCNVSLIRDDLTTIMCEVTSSIRTRSLSDEYSESTQLHGAPSAQASMDKSQTSKDKKEPHKAANDELPPVDSGGDMKELLLCLRPIRDGEETVGEEFRFNPTETLYASSHKAAGERNPAKNITDENTPTIKISEGSTQMKGISQTSAPTTTHSADANVKYESSRSRPMKKRPLSATSQIPSISVQSPPQKLRTSTTERPSNEAEKSVAESLMLMSSHRK